MNTKISLALSALTVLASWVDLRGGDDVSVPNTTGRVLVLANEQTIEGNIARQGDLYRIRRSVGEVYVQADNVLRVCQNNLEAFQFIRSRANPRDPDEHIRLANWCQAHGLKKNAIEEARAALQLRPNDEATQRLLHHLEHAASTNHPAAAVKPHEDAETGPAPPAVNNDSLSVFVTRVQPILMNACANCHATGRGGAFKLTRTYDRQGTSRRTALQNLSAVLARVNPEQPQTSVFLSKAVSIHGDMPHAALKNRETPAYRTLEEWVQATVESNPQLAVKTASTSAPPVSLQYVTTPEVSDKKIAEPSSGTPARDKQATKPGAVAPRQPAPPVADTADTSGDPADAFDPITFNRQMHQQKQETGKK